MAMQPYTPVFKKETCACGEQLGPDVKPGYVNWGESKGKPVAMGYCPSCRAPHVMVEQSSRQASTPSTED